MRTFIFLLAALATLLTLVACAPPPPPERLYTSCWIAGWGTWRSNSRREKLLIYEKMISPSQYADGFDYRKNTVSKNIEVDLDAQAAVGCLIPRPFVQASDDWDWRKDQWVRRGYRPVSTYSLRHDFSQ